MVVSWERFFYGLLARLSVPHPVHYINGSDTLPAPLEPAREQQAVAELARGSAQARRGPFLPHANAHPPRPLRLYLCKDVVYRAGTHGTCERMGNERI